MLRNIIVTLTVTLNLVIKSKKKKNFFKFKLHRNIFILKSFCLFGLMQ